MKESVIYQEIEAQGIQKGRLEGKLEGEANLVLRQLNRRIGNLSTKLAKKIQGFSIEQLENLGEALLDFNSQEDLVNWLDSN
jgi:predicted transposase YdaD